MSVFYLVFFFSSRRRHTILVSDWSSDVCSSDLHFQWQNIRYSKNAGRARKDQARDQISESAESDCTVGNSGECSGEIGRASCRERGWRGRGGGEVEGKRKRERMGRVESGGRGID